MVLVRHFQWIQPDSNSRHVAVEQPSDVEVYKSAGELPVRVTTSDVEIEGSRATFDVSEHASKTSVAG